MTIQNITQVRERVIERLADITVVQSARIEDATEIYQDLRVSGWDLWDFLGWVGAEFGTDFSAMNISKYSPGEGAQLFAAGADFAKQHGATGFQIRHLNAVDKVVAIADFKVGKNP